MDAETRGRILVEARSWLNTPYQHNARVKGVGVDCGHFLHAVYSTEVLLRPMPADYAADWTMHEGTGELYLEFLADYAHESPTPVIGCPVVFKIGLRYGHAGIVTDKGVIHAWGRTQFGCVQEKSLGVFRKYPRKYFDLSI